MEQQVVANTVRIMIHIETCSCGGFVGGAASKGATPGVCQQAGPSWGFGTERDRGGLESIFCQGQSLANRRLLCHTGNWRRAWNELGSATDLGVSFQSARVTKQTHTPSCDLQTATMVPVCKCTCGQLSIITYNCSQADTVTMRSVFVIHMMHRPVQWLIVAALTRFPRALPLYLHQITSSMDRYRLCSLDLLL